jgi:hypothetical protein
MERKRITSDEGIRHLFNTEMPELVDAGLVKQRIKTVSGATLVLLEDIGLMETDMIIKGLNRSIRHVNSFLTNHGIDIVHVPYRVYICSSSEQVRQIAEKNGRDNIPLGIRGTVVKGQHVTRYVAENENFTKNVSTAQKLGLDVSQAVDPTRIKAFLDDMGAHEYVHPTFDLNRLIKNAQVENDLPIWLTEGLAIYIGGKSRNLDYIKIARDFEGKLPPVSLRAINENVGNGLYAFGHIRLQRFDRHPAFISCGSFIQFLDLYLELGFKAIWDYAIQSHDRGAFYAGFKNFTGLSFDDAENLWLAAIDRKPLEVKSGNYQMDVVNFDETGNMSTELVLFDFLNVNS